MQPHVVQAEQCVRGREGDTSTHAVRKQANYTQSQPDKVLYKYRVKSMATHFVYCPGEEDAENGPNGSESRQGKSE